MAEEAANNTGQNLSDYTNLETNLSKPEDIQPLAGISDLDGGIVGFGVDNKLDIPGPTIMNNVVGYPDNLPGGNGIGDTRNALKDFVSAQSQNIADQETQSSYGKMFNYDAGPDGANFYDRYAAYGSEKFEEVGFHPFRDNQANFNASTTWWNDVSIMMRHSFPVLFKRGFIDGPKSFARMLQGDFTGANLEDAEEYERAAAIGQSTRGGIGAFFNNTLMNFGYTAGIITEAIAEEFALSLLTTASGGATGGIQAARTGKIIDDIGKGLGKVKSGVKAVDDLATLSKTPTAARRFWETSRGKKLNSALRLLNPLENTVDALSGIGKVGRAGKHQAYLDGLAKMAATPGAFYRDVRNINMAISESRLEAGMVENKIFNTLYDNYYRDFGKVPDSNEQFAMRQKAKKGSLETFTANSGIIYLTNQMTFSNIIRPKGGLNNFLKQTRKEIYEVSAKSGEKQFGTLGKVIYDNTKKAFVFEKNNFQNLVKSWWKQPGYATAKKTLGYFKANVSEGIQENLQETIARANERHYIESYKLTAPASSLYSKGVNKMSYKAQMGLEGTPMSTYYDEFKKEFSAQGFETFMSGFLMGTFAKPLNKAMPFLATQKARIFNKDLYEDWKKTKLEVTKGIVENLNEIDIDQLINSRLVNLGTQEKVADIQTKGSKKEALDAEVDSFVSSLSLMRKTGTTDVFIEKLKHMQELTDPELLNAVKSTEIENVPKYRKRIDNAIKKLQSIDVKFKQAEKIFENPAKIENLTPEQMATAEGRALQRLHHAWEKSVENFVYLNEAFEDTIQRMSSITSNYLGETSLGNAKYGATKVLFQPQTINTQIGVLEQEITVTEQSENVSKEDREKLKHKKDQVKYLREFQTAQALFYGFYQRQETPTLNLARKRLKEEDGIDNPSEEQIEAKLNELLGDITDSKKQVEVSKRLKDAHDKYIRSVAAEVNGTILNSNLDKAFNDLTDFYKLEFEKRSVAEHIDLLSDPGEFLELVLANERAFDRLDALKNQLNSEIVDEQVNKVALDQLLNALANEGPPIYMDENQVVELLKNNKVPEFFTGLKDEIYEPGSPVYERGKELVEQYISLSEILTSNIDQATGVEMTPQMKKAVDEIKRIFKNSENISGFKGFYIEDGKLHSRVSNVMDKIFEDTGYNRMDLIYASAINAFEEDDGSFVFNKVNIDVFLNEIERDVELGSYGDRGGGITADTIAELRLELESILEGKVLNSYQKQIDELEKGKIKYQGSTVAAKNIILIDQEIEKLKERVLTADTITADELATVLQQVIPTITYEGGRVRGLSLDDMVRDFFDSGSELKYENYKDKISQEAFMGIFGPEGHLSKLKQKADAGEIYVFAKNLKIADSELYDKDGKKLGNVAGALDLIIVDKKGKVYIVDLKTGSQTKWSKYLTPGDKNFDYKKYVENSMQQRGYSNLIYNKSNGVIDPETLILPLAVSENESGYIESFEVIPDRSFKGQDTLDNLVDGYMFMETDNRARYKMGNSTIKPTDIDKYIPRKSVAKEEPILNEEKDKLDTKQTVSLSELDALERKKEKLEEEIKSIKRKSVVDQDQLDEVQDELKDVNQSIRRAKKTPEPEDEDKEFMADLKKRRLAARKNIIQTEGGMKDRVFMESSYVNNEGKEIPIKKEVILATASSDNAQAIEDATTAVIIRIDQLYRYDIEKHKRKALVEETIDNLTGRVFGSEIGKIFDVEFNQFGEEGAYQRIMIDSVYITEDGNYGILARNLKNDKIYDMIVTPEGNVLVHNNQGKVGDSRTNAKVTIDDVIFFEEGDFARKRLPAEKRSKQDTKQDTDQTEQDDQTKKDDQTKQEPEIKTDFGNVSLDNLKLALAALEQDLEFEKGEFGNPDNIPAIEAQIKAIKDKIKEVEKLVEKDDTQEDAKQRGPAPVNEVQQLTNDINDESKTDTLDQYNRLSRLASEFIESTGKELRGLIDLKANAIMGTTNLIESDKKYTFKEDLELLDDVTLKIGDQVRVLKMDALKKQIMVRTIGRRENSFVTIPLDIFESKIDFGDDSGPTDNGSDEVKETGDVLKDFLNDVDAQSDLDKSTKDYFDTSNDKDIFNKC